MAVVANAEKINTFEELISQLMWYWPDGSHPEGQPRIRMYAKNKNDITGMNDYVMNKTYIIAQLSENSTGDVFGFFFLQYKTSIHEMTREVYEKFKAFYELLYEV